MDNGLFSGENIKSWYYISKYTGTLLYEKYDITNDTLITADWYDKKVKKKVKYIDGSRSTRNAKYVNHACIQNEIFDIWKDNRKSPELCIRANINIGKDNIFVWTTEKTVWIILTEKNSGANMYHASLTL